MKTHLSYPLLVCAAVLLAGCAVGPDYVQPAAPAPAAFRHQAGWLPVAEAQAAAPAGDGWWAAFGDPTLDALVQGAATGSLTVAQAVARLEQAQAQINAARAAGLPQVGASLGATRNGGDGRFTSARNTSFDAGLSARWVPDLWGRVARSVEAGRASAEASAADVAGARLTAQAAIAQAYFAIRTIDGHAALLAQTQQAYERSLRLTRNQYEAGVAARADVIQAETQVQTLRTQVHDLRRQRALQENAIAVLAGEAPGALVPAVDAVLPGVPAVPPQLPSVLLVRRPDVVASERLVAAANANIGVAEGAWWPELTLSASTGGSAAQLARVLDAPQRVWSFGPALAATLFDGGARAAALAQARALHTERVAAYRQTVLTGLREVDDALAALQNLAAQEAEQQRLVELATENERVVTTRYRGGLVTFLEVATAQNTTLTARRTALNVRAARLAASVQLVAALGGGWGSGV